MKYSAKIDLTNKNNSHTLAYDLIQGFSTGKELRILEVGCSGGYFGLALREVGHTVWGVEPDKGSATSAAEVLDYAFNGTLDDFIAAHSNEFFDVVMFGDVLEHLNDPKAVLIQVKSLLSKNGAVVASVPNVGHITVRSMLLEGRWEYDELGILDRTHLKFFTEKTLLELFESAGFQVNEINKVRLSAEQVQGLVGLDLNDDFVVFIEENVSDSSLDVFQHVLIAENSNDVSGSIDSNMQEKSPPKVELTNSAGQAKAMQELQALTIANLEGQKAIQQEALLETQKQIEELKLSKSWKITKPLRMLSSLLRKERPSG